MKHLEDMRMEFIEKIDAWIVDSAAYPGLFAVFLALFLGTVVIPNHILYCTKDSLMRRVCSMSRLCENFSNYTVNKFDCLNL